MDIGQDYLNDFTVPGLFGMFNQQNPADAGMPYLNQIQQQLPGYFDPWINAGKAALPQLQQQYGGLMNDPTGMMNKMGAHFQQSPGYQWQTGQAVDAANRAASAGGMLGTPAEQQSIAGTVGQMANGDYYNYMNHAMNMYGMGLNGMQGMANQGLSASRGLGEDLSQALMSQAQLAYAGQADQNQAKQGMFGNMMGMAGAAFGA